AGRGWRRPGGVAGPIELARGRALEGVGQSQPLRSSALGAGAAGAVGWPGRHRVRAGRRPVVARSGESASDRLFARPGGPVAGRIRPYAGRPVAGAGCGVALGSKSGVGAGTDRRQLEPGGAPEDAGTGGPLARLGWRAGWYLAGAGPARRSTGSAAGDQSADGVWRTSAGDAGFARGPGTAESEPGGT